MLSSGKILTVWRSDRSVCSLSLPSTCRSHEARPELRHTDVAASPSPGLPPAWGTEAMKLLSTSLLGLPSCFVKAERSTRYTPVLWQARQDLCRTQKCAPSSRYFAAVLTVWGPKLFTFGSSAVAAGTSMPSDLYWYAGFLGSAPNVIPALDIKAVRRQESVFMGLRLLKPRDRRQRLHRGVGGGSRRPGACHLFSPNSGKERWL